MKIFNKTYIDINSKQQSAVIFEGKKQQQSLKLIQYYMFCINKYGFLIRSVLTAFVHITFRDKLVHLQRN